MENYKKLLTELYKKYAPEKLDQLDFYLNKYKGKEEQFYISQKAKYENTKTLKDSKKILEEAMARIAQQKKEPKKTKTTKASKKTEREDADKKKAAKEKKTIAVPPAPKVEKKAEKPLVLVSSSKPKAEKEDIKIPLEKEEKKESAPKPIVVPPESPKKKEEENPIPPIVVVEEEENRRGFWFFARIAIILILLSISAYYLYFRLQEPVVIETEVAQEVEQHAEPIVIAETDSLNTVTEEQEALVEEAQEEPETALPTTDRLYAHDISGTTIFIACFAVKKEEQARKEVGQLKKIGFNAYYYWIPDIIENGNSYFKIVVGPFDNSREARPSLTKIQERINFDAYIIKLK